MGRANRTQCDDDKDDDDDVDDDVSESLKFD